VTPRKTRELPQANGPQVRLNLRIVGGFDVRKYCQCLRQTGITQPLAYALFPRPRANYAFAHAVSLPPLKADAAGGGCQRLSTRLAPPQGQHLLLAGGQILSLAVSQRVQGSLVACHRFFDPALLNLSAVVPVKPQSSIHDREVVTVVNKP
jgi:hypothetical protein